MEGVWFALGQVVHVEGTSSERVERVPGSAVHTIEVYVLRKDM